LNSIFALSAIGVFYVYAFRWHEKIRGLILISLIIPITITANFLRVLALVLIAYYAGVDKIEGSLHDLTGIALFIVAVALMFLCEGLINLVARVFERSPSSSQVANTKA
jgi:exosortase/archaeosortase family protein